MRGRKYALALLAAGSLLAGGQAVSAAPHSNMGLCSAYLGQMQVRDDVNRIINDIGVLYGIDNPGELYKIRAQQRELGTPEEECQQRPH